LGIHFALQFQIEWSGICSILLKTDERLDHQIHGGVDPKGQSAKFEVPFPFWRISRGYEFCLWGAGTNPGKLAILDNPLKQKGSGIPRELLAADSAN